MGLSLEIWIRDWNWGLIFGIGIGDRDWGLGSGIGIGDWGLRWGMIVWIRTGD